MKIAVLSDIHGNLPALEAVTADIAAWQPDVVVVNGDVINRGPSNLACLQWVLRHQREAGWVLLRGNHEDYVLTSADPTIPRTGPKFELRQFSEWTYQQVGTELMQELAAMPDRFGWRAPDGSTFLAMHGTVQGNRVGIYPQTTDEEIRPLIAPAPSLFVTAHTHRALIRQVGHTTVVNIGSAGLPFDENQQVGYGRFTWTASAGWQAEVRRLDYDRQRAELDMVTTGFLDEAGPFAPLVLVELRLALGLIGRWAKQYEADFLQGEFGLAESVGWYLAEHGYEAFSQRP
ncbi:MAG: metallophosphoesterase [Chloroflexi bacterium]|nr:metallophosphoesterase [Chloroflexota bacterium]